MRTPGQDLTKAGVKPNPYEGMLSAGGPTPIEYDKSEHWKYCSAIYEKYTGKHAPSSQEVVPGPGGKTLETNASINDACQVITMFHDIATRVGKYLNNDNWTKTVDTFGHIENYGSGPYSSLHKGKYDAEDNFFDFCNSGAHATFFAGRSKLPEENLPRVHFWPEIFYFPAGGASVMHFARPGEVTLARLTRRNGRYWLAVVPAEFVLFDEKKNWAKAEQLST